jgi:hypothetical protein
MSAVERCPLDADAVPGSLDDRVLLGMDCSASLHADAVLGLPAANVITMWLARWSTVVACGEYALRSDQDCPDVAM